MVSITFSLASECQDSWRGAAGIIPGKIGSRSCTKRCSDCAHGVVEGCVQFLCVQTSIPDWCTVLCGREDQSLGRDAKGLGAFPVRQRIRESWDVIFSESCCRKVRAWSSFSSRYIGVFSNCSALPSTPTLSSSLASWMLRWNAENVVITTLSFRRQC